MSTEEQGRIADKVQDIIFSGFRTPQKPKPRDSKTLWAAVEACGTELWLDTGDIDEASSLWCREFKAVTTNNTLLNREVQKGTYDDLVQRVASALSGLVGEEDLLLEIAFVLNAWHALRLSHELGAMVSVELHTDLANDAERSVAYGRRYHRIAPDRFYVKVPLTPAGLLAARQLGQDGVPVNFTLGFSARENHLIAAVARPSFVNVFLGRLNSFVSDNELGSGHMVGEKATLASQRMLSELREDLGIESHQIAASMREGAQVLALAGVDVMTMPTGVAHGFEDLDPATDEIESRAECDPEIELNADVDRQALGIDCLWDVADEQRDAVRELLADYVATISPDGICEFLAERGMGDLLPRWTDEDESAVAEDGKIPNYARWKDRLADGEVGLDALMNISGLHYFAGDQKAMDDRIRSML